MLVGFHFFRESWKFSIQVCLIKESFVAKNGEGRNPPKPEDLLQREKLLFSNAAFKKVRLLQGKWLKADSQKHACSSKQSCGKWGRTGKVFSFEEAKMVFCRALFCRAVRSIPLYRVYTLEYNPNSRKGYFKAVHSEHSLWHIIKLGSW